MQAEFISDMLSGKRMGLAQVGDREIEIQRDREKGQEGETGGQRQAERERGSDGERMKEPFSSGFIVCWVG